MTLHCHKMFVGVCVSPSVDIDIYKYIYKNSRGESMKILNELVITIFQRYIGNTLKSILDSYYYNAYLFYLTQAKYVILVY